MTDQPPPGGAYPPPPSSPGPSGGPEPEAGKHEAPPPPPPPGGGAYPPPPGPSSPPPPPPPGPAIRTLPKSDYTSWFSRVLAFVIDILPYVILHSIGTGILMTTQQTSCVTDITSYAVNQVCATQNSPVGVLAQALTSAVGLFYLIWNYGYRQGTTGSTLGKSVLNFKVVSEVTGQPIGFGRSILRVFAHFVDAIICFVGFLFPLWDAKRQTLADKIMSTVCLPIGGR
uniref:RDD family protein n=1 Tax=Mycobacterium sp. HUMS_1102779 TaxID=3383487 RepID=UPI003899D958